MGEFPRKADGRRVFTTEFKRQVAQQMGKGEKTLGGPDRPCAPSETSMATIRNAVEKR